MPRIPQLIEGGHQVTRELAIPVSYEGRHVAWQRIDRVVDNAVIVEIKATEKLSPADKPQLITYLRASRYQVGVLLHFGPAAKFYRVIDYPKRRGLSVAGVSSNSSISPNSCPNGLGLGWQTDTRQVHRGNASPPVTARVCSKISATPTRASPDPRPAAGPNDIPGSAPRTTRCCRP